MINPVKSVKEELSVRQKQLMALRESLVALHIELQNLRRLLPNANYKLSQIQTDKAIANFLKETEGIFHL
jgi:predicted  nucleic acid-binding Zn-ribbon protein